MILVYILFKAAILVISFIAQQIKILSFVSALLSAVYLLFSFAHIVTCFTIQIRRTRDATGNAWLWLLGQRSRRTVKPNRRRDALRRDPSFVLEYTLHLLQKRRLTRVIQPKDQHLYLDLCEQYPPETGYEAEHRPQR